MKKNDWIILAVSLVYSFLFYSEKMGLNCLIFSMCIVSGFLVNNKTIIKNKSWLVMALTTVLSGMSVVFYGNVLSVLTNIISLLILSGISLSARSSVFFSAFHGFLSIVTSPYYFAIGIFNSRLKEKSGNKVMKKAILIFIPILIVLLFFFMYKNSNPIFATFANKINLDWISFDWIIFTLVGMILIFGFYYPKQIKSFANYDENSPENLENKEAKHLVIFGKTILTVDEFFSGKVLFILLNCLIAIVNLLDFNFIFNSSVLPDGLTFAEFLHQGVGMLVASIFISIIIILFFFRGELNFFEKSRTLKLLAYIWILQNILMLVSVCLKNELYIENYGLTYKRIGIYVYSLLTTIGLLTTFIKILKLKANLFLVRINGWTFYSVLFVSCFINWDQLIVNYNMKGKHEIDMYYLLSLSDKTIPSLQEYKSKIKNEDQRTHYDKLLNHKIDRFTDNQSQRTWKSWVYLNDLTGQKIKMKQSK